MKVLSICILFFLAWGSAVGQDDKDATKPIFPQQLTASILLTYCESSSLTDLGRTRQRYCWGFISGVEEATRLPLRASERSAELKICVPEGLSSRSLAKTYISYARRRETDLGRPAAQVVVDALSESYPCLN